MEITSLHVPRNHQGRDYPICLDWPVPSHAAIVEWGYSAMDIWQADRCAFCGHSNGDRRLYRDHDHDTGLMRGLLCATCNIQEANNWYYDSWTMYTSFANPAYILGIEEWYVPPRLIQRGDAVQQWLFSVDLTNLHWIAPSLVYQQP